MDNRTYKLTPGKELISRKVITTIDLDIGYCKVPKGTVCTITRKYMGFYLETEPCPTCGVKVKVENVPPENIRLLPIGFFKIVKS